MPCPKLARPCHGLACHVKIVRAVSEHVMIDPCQCRSVSFRVHVDPCQSVSNPGVVIFTKKKRLRQDTYQQQGLSNPGVVILTKNKKTLTARYLSATELVKSRGGHFHRKKAPAARYLSATGLVKSRGAHFHRKKTPAARYLSVTGLVKSRGGHFHRKKSACGKLVSSNRACQSPDHGCIMDFDNCKVTFRTDHTPLHRIAVQF